jgi:hypothetical protein
VSLKLAQWVHRKFMDIMIQQVRSTAGRAARVRHDRREVFKTDQLIFVCAIHFL